MHFTVGVNSRALIRDRGLAQFLLPKVGRPFQFAESDAACIDACEWGDEGPGLEFERMSWDEPLTEDQIFWGGYLVQTLHEQDGYPLVFHGGARLPVGDGFRGFVNHGSLVHNACDQHTDGVTADDFARMIQGASVVTPEQMAELGQREWDTRKYIEQRITERHRELRKVIKTEIAESEQRIIAAFKAAA